MKIAILTDGMWPYFKGGKEKRWFEIARRLSKNNDVHIYTMKWWKGKDIKKENGYTLHAISPLYSMYNKSGKRTISQALRFAWHVYPVLRKEEFDILDVDQMPFFHIFPALLVSKRRRKPMIVTWHEYWGKYWFDYLGTMGLFGFIIEKISDIIAPRAVAISELTYNRLSTQKKDNVPLFVDVDLIDGIDCEKKEYDIAFDGRLISHKNVETLVKVANKNNFKTIIMGGGPDEEKLRKLAKENVTFTGFVQDSEEIFANVKKSKVYVSLSEREGFGISVLQALTCGVPVITSNHLNNASKSMIKNTYNGFAVDLNEEIIAEGIRYCIKHNKKMSKNAKESSNRFVPEKIVAQLEKIYLEATK